MEQMVGSSGTKCTVWGQSVCGDSVMTVGSSGVCVLLSVQSGDSQGGWWEGRARASNETTLRSDFYPGVCLSANDFYPCLLIF